VVSGTSFVKANLQDLASKFAAWRQEESDVGPVFKKACDLHQMGILAKI